MIFFFFLIFGAGRAYNVVVHGRYRQAKESKSGNQKAYDY